MPINEDPEALLQQLEQLDLQKEDEQKQIPIEILTEIDEDKEFKSGIVVFICCSVPTAIFAMFTCNIC